MKNDDKTIIAELISSVMPNQKQLDGIENFLRKKYSGNVKLITKKNDDFHGGFRLIVGNDVYDWNNLSKVSQLKTELEKIDNRQNVVSLIKNTFESFTPYLNVKKIGIVQSVSDGVVKVKGLKGVFYGEILAFPDGTKGIVQNLYDDYADCILFYDGSVKAGDEVFRTEKYAGVGVSEKILGRVVNALGTCIDGEKPFVADKFMFVENSAPSIIDRSSVNRPLKTGILAIDSMFPIGKGQRELIIGDRQTGKTTIAIDAILNQKGKDVICIYCAIGQKAGTVAKTVNLLKNKGAMKYTAVVLAGAGESASMQYIAPYSACAIGEYFMEQGKDVLIVYDDLSKHAVAYRALSLLLGRSPGREAYPGDVFYLHSRLLERSAQLNAKMGGGSMTALPIVETQAGDVSAYVPTNIISITDGQIFLENELFLSGQRPAVNVGLSVSRVGGDAQTKAMKKATGTLRLELAQFREMKMFTQFSSDLDDGVRNQLKHGERLLAILRQNNSSPMEEWREVIFLLLALNKILDLVPRALVRSEADKFCNDFITEKNDVAERINQGFLSEEDKNLILELAKKYFYKGKYA